MKTVTDLFEKHLGVREYNGIVATMLKWYYGELRKVAWCAVSMSYMMNQLGILDQIGGKNQNVYRMMTATEKVWKEKKVGKFYWRSEIPKGMYIPRGTIVFNLYSSKPMTAESSKHVTSVYAGFNWAGSGKWMSLGGNQSDYIQTKEYNQGNIYAIFIPDYSKEKDEGHKTLKKGSKGDEVVQLQMMLNNLGYPDDEYKPLVLDGSFGSKTEQAVKCFQKHNDLKVDGICGKLTWAKLDEVSKQKPKYATALRDLVVHTGPSSNKPKKAIIKKGATVIYSFMQNKWLYLPKWNGWITSRKDYTKTE